MKKIALCFACFLIANVSAMELKEFKSEARDICPQTVAAVIKIPAIAQLLAAAGVTVPFDTAHIINRGFAWWVAVYPRFSFDVTPSPDHIKSAEALSKKFTQWYLYRAKDMYDSAWLSVPNLRESCGRASVVFDGPNCNGVVVGCITDNHATITTATCDHYDYSYRILAKQRIWSTALSEGNRFVISSQVDGDKDAHLFCYSLIKQVKTKKIFFSKTIKEKALWNTKAEKQITLQGDKFNLFRKISFLHENLLIGLNEQGKLYSIIPYYNDSAKDPELYHLAFKLNGARYVKDFAVDAYDKHSLIIVDNNDNMYAARITAKNLIAKKIKTCNDIKLPLVQKKVEVTTLSSVSLDGNTACLIFNTPLLSRKVHVALPLISTECCLQDKIDSDKASN
jgi:hypothetical protein